jgi:transposase
VRSPARRRYGSGSDGKLLTVLVTAAGVQDPDRAIPLLRRLRIVCPRIALVWADGGYAGRLVSWTAEHLSGLRLAIVKRSDKPGFVLLPRRWVVERTLGWITWRRRRVRDYERRADTHEAIVRWAMAAVMTRRLARRPAPVPALSDDDSAGDLVA